MQGKMLPQRDTAVRMDNLIPRCAIRNVVTSENECWESDIKNAF